MDFDVLLDDADAEGLAIKERPFQTYDGRIKGKNIYLRRDMDSTTKKCVLAEELGHHYTSVGNILDQSDPNNRKQERKARLWGYDRLIGLSGIIQAFEHGCQSCYEMADYLGVTEAYLRECIDCYRNKYGISKKIGNYIIYFEPVLAVGEIMD